MAPDDMGLVGTPYFRAGLVAIVAAWLALMLVLWS
jgi:hypothetical protein